MAKTVTALYEDYATAQSAVEDLLNHDFRREDIRVLVQEALAKDGVRIAEEDTSGVAAGVGIGAALGGVGGLVLGLTAFPLLAALVSAGVGAPLGVSWASSPKWACLRTRRSIMQRACGVVACSLRCMRRTTWRNVLRLSSPPITRCKH